MADIDRINSVDRAESAPAPPERRQDPRRAVEVWMEEFSGAEVYFRRTANISAGGAYFDRAIPHAVGTAVTLKFMLPGSDHFVVARAEVVGAQEKADGLGMRVRFIGFEADGQALLQRFLDAAGEHPRRP